MRKIFNTLGIVLARSDLASIKNSINDRDQAEMLNLIKETTKMWQDLQDASVKIISKIEAICIEGRNIENGFCGP